VINVNGIHGGYGGPGMKTVLPATAMAKLDIRLVPDQDPHEIVGLLRAHLDRHGFGAVEATLAERPEHPSRVDPTTRGCATRPPRSRRSTARRRRHDQLRRLRAAAPVRRRARPAGVMLGVGYAEGRAHAPDENVRWIDVERGTLATVRTIERWAGLDAHRLTAGRAGGRHRRPGGGAHRRGGRAPAAGSRPRQQLAAPEAARAEGEQRRRHHPEHGAERHDHAGRQHDHAGGLAHDQQDDREHHHAADLVRLLERVDAGRDEDGGAQPTAATAGATHSASTHHMGVGKKSRPMTGQRRAFATTV
jgi:hypothetical protein